MQPPKSQWIMANKYVQTGGKTNRSHLQLIKYKMFSLTMAYTGFHEVYGAFWLRIELL